MRQQDPAIVSSVFQFLAAAFAVATLLAAGGCDSHKAPLTPGQLRLEFVSSSDSDVSLLLSNGLSKSVAVRGGRTPTFSIGIWKGDAGLECEQRGNGRSEEEPIGIADGNWKEFEVPSGEQAKVVVNTTLPHRYEGGSCRISIQLADGTLVGPIEFNPPAS
jgi:hypothetical protein